MNVELMRGAIIKVYDSDSWKRKVRAMYDDQVIAVYYKFLRTGKFKELLERKINEKNSQKLSRQFTQLNMFNLIDKEKNNG